jgi:para-aminobenzoate synthetase component 1
MSIIASTPERFWRKKDRFLETRPIKGTIPRGDDLRSDRRNLRQLLVSPKDRAELLMITDLERNDLGKVAEAGSVRTRMLHRPRAARSVWHLESTVTATARDGVDWTEVMRATFPGGSITGAPKIRAVEILRDLERIPRGVYCGAFGWVDAGGNADFAIPIRTAVHVGSTVRLFGGGGIVADSDPKAEYYESLVKIAPMLDALTYDDRTQTRQTFQSTINETVP